MSARKGIACLAHDCYETLEFEPQVVRVTMDLEGGQRLRVSRRKVEVGPKGGTRTVTKQVREDIDALLAALRDKHDTGDER